MRPATSRSRRRWRSREAPSQTRRWPISRAEIGRTTVVGAALVLALVAVAALAPVIVDLVGVRGPNVRNPGTVNVFGVPSGPSSAHPFGVDQMGRDILARVLYGLRSSLEAGALGAVIASAVGGIIGLIIGLSKRWVAAIVMAAVDVLLAFPALLLGLGIAGGDLVHPGLLTVVLIIVLSSFPYVARSARSRVRSPSSLLRALPAYTILLIAPSIVLEAALSFLGAGLHAPTVSLGAIIFGGGANIVAGGGAWWYLVFPGVVLLLCVIAFKLVGSRLLPASEPLTRTRGEAPSSVSRYIVLRVVRAAVLVLAVVAVTLGIFSRAHLDHSFWDLLRLHLGNSRPTGHPVLSSIVDGLPATVSLAAGGLFICLVASIPLGAWWAHGRGRLPARAPLPLPATPVFWLGLLSIYLFSTSVGRLAVFDGPGAYRGLTVAASSWFGSLLLPWLVLAAGFVVFYAWALGSSLSDAMASTYVLTARAKGLSDRRVFIRHSLRAAAPPMLSVFGLGLGALIGGIVLVETVFEVPGIGRLASEGVARGNLPVVQGVVLLAGFFLVIAKLLLDIAQALIDPRVRHL